MNEENTKYLIEHFPKLYAGVGKPLTESLMGFGFECGDGWFELVRDLSEKLEPHGVEAIQVKEKFGGLRFYLVGGAPDEVWDLIDEAETKSEKICELCGEPGTLRGKGWVKTLCSACDEGG
jgi:hypothetical protein